MSTHTTQTHTANTVYMYQDVFCGQTLDQHVGNVHKIMAHALSWNYFPLRQGSFGYDNLAVSIGHALTNLPLSSRIASGSAPSSLCNDGEKGILQDTTRRLPTLDELSELVHNGWTQNYTYWRDNEPHIKHPSVWRGPKWPLGDSRRDQLANTKYADLPPDEQKKDTIVAQYLLELLAATQ